MSKLNDIILKLCPDGVEFVNLGDVCEIKTGQAVSKKMISENRGSYPVINSGKDPLGFINTWNTENDPIGITTRGAGVGSVTWQDGKYFRGSLNYSVTIKDKNFLDVRFLYHVLFYLEEEIHSLCVFTGIPALNANKLKTLKIPIPPIEVQKKIVEILDKFEKLIHELTTELTTELTLRRKQFKYYRDQLLTFDSDVEFVNLGDVCQILRGKRLTTKDLITNGQYPVIHGGTSPMGYYDKSNRKAGTTIVINTGNAGCVFYIDVEFWSSDACFSLYPNEKILDKFLYFVVSSKEKELKKKIRVAAMPTIDSKAVSDLKIPIPSIEKQKKIVDILDRFDSLCNDLISGIPAEIIARKKQYKFYRDQLLTFSELKKSPD